MAEGFLCDKCKQFWDYEVFPEMLGVRVVFNLQMNGTSPKRIYCRNCTLPVYKILDEYEITKEAKK